MIRKHSFKFFYVLLKELKYLDFFNRNHRKYKFNVKKWFIKILLIGKKFLLLYTICIFLQFFSIAKFVFEKYNIQNHTLTHTYTLIDTFNDSNNVTHNIIHNFTDIHTLWHKQTLTHIMTHTYKHTIIHLHTKLQTMKKWHI